jgi:hypothetical protein
VLGLTHCSGFPVHRSSRRGYSSLFPSPELTSCLFQLKIGPDISVPVAASFADETRLNVGQPQFVRPAAPLTATEWLQLIICAVDQEPAHTASRIWARVIFGGESKRPNDSAHLLVCCRYFFALSPISTSLRMASERPGASACVDDQLSTLARNSSERRIVLTGSLPVAGRPAPGRRPPLDLGVSFFIS